MSQSLVTNFYSSRKRRVNVSKDLRNVAEPKKATRGFKNTSKATSNSTSIKKGDEIDKQLLQSPKRNLPPPREGTPTKKKNIEKTNKALEQKQETSAPISPLKLKENLARKRLDLDLSESSTSVNSRSEVKKILFSPKKTPPTTPSKVEAIINQSRSKLLHSQRLGELKASLARFSEKTAKFKEYESNPQKVTCVITQKSPIKPSVTPAYKRFSHLAEDSVSTLVLPSSYKFLAEQFQNTDTVVAMLNNRKEKITFEKVCSGVEKIMKRNFTKHHLGQIMTVFPSAYTLTIEKLKSTIQENKSSDYQLVISQNLVSDNPKMTDFMSLVARRKEFNRNLLAIVKKHHQAFLKAIKFDPVPEESLKRWHLKFNIDSVPDVPSAPLPESPDKKTFTAKDVLDKIKFSYPNKVESALKKVAEESANTDLKEIQKPKPVITKNALKGISSDLLEKIRAKESASLLKAMTSPSDAKRQAMLKRLPKIVNILWHFFVAERKAAVHIDVVVEKIMYSYGNFSNPDFVKDHLKLISEKFPGWLTFTQISKGLYIAIDKKQNINDMLDNAKLH